MKVAFTLFSRFHAIWMKYGEEWYFTWIVFKCYALFCKDEAFHMAYKLQIPCYAFIYKRHYSDDFSNSNALFIFCFLNT